MVKGKVALILATGFILCLSACLGTGVSGTYECIKSGSGFTSFKQGDTIEFKSNGEAILRSHLGGPSIVGEYEVKGDKISIKISLLGTKMGFDGKIEGNLIKMNDGAILEKK